MWCHQNMRWRIPVSLQYSFSSPAFAFSVCLNHSGDSRCDFAMNPSVMLVSNNMISERIGIVT